MILAEPSPYSRSCPPAPMSASSTLASPDKAPARMKSPMQPLLNSEIQEISAEEFQKTVARTNGIVKRCLKERMPRSLRQALRNALDVCENLEKGMLHFLVFTTGIF